MKQLRPTMHEMKQDIDRHIEQPDEPGPQTAMGKKYCKALELVFALQARLVETNMALGTVAQLYHPPDTIITTIRSDNADLLKQVDVWRDGMVNSGRR